MSSTSNILDLHTYILQQFERAKTELPQLAKRIEDLESLLESCTARFRHQIENELKELKRLYKSIDDDEDRNFYLLQVTPMLEEYRQELAKPIELSFMGQPLIPDTSVADNIVSRFTRIAEHTCPSLYCKLEETISNSQCCSNCNSHSQESSQVCAQCGAQQNGSNTTFSYNDTNRINMSSKYTYDRRLHFRDSINQFQGKQNSTIKQDVYDKLIEQFELHNLLLEDKSLPRQIRFQKITKQQIAMFLKEINYAKHYEDINLIYHNLTGTKLDDISHLEETLMNDFDILSDLYNELYVKTRKTDRKSFINTQYVLFQLLRRHKYPCERSDFNFLKTIERKGFHDEICSDLFARLSWNFSPCF